MSPNLPIEKKRREGKERTSEKRLRRRLRRRKERAVGRWTLDEVVGTARDVDDGTSMNVMSHTLVVVVHF